MTLLRLPLAQPIESRTASLTKDSVSSNCYFEGKDGVRELVKRPGTTEVTITGDTFKGQSNTGKGMYTWQDHLYVASKNNLYKVTTGGVSIEIAPIAGDPAKISFNEQLTNPYLLFHDTVKLYYVTTTGTVSEATELTTLLTAPMVYGIVQMDGHTVVMENTGKLWNSGLEDPTSWNALDYNFAQAEPDPGVGIVKHFNYCVAFGTWSTEFFYNSGASSGTILQRNDSARMEIGCADANTIAELEQAIIFVGKSKKHGQSVYVLEGLSPVKISNPYIERYLNSSSNGDMLGYCFKIEGHTFYVLTLLDMNLTLVYDMDEKQWYNWTYATIYQQGNAKAGIAIAGVATAGSNSDQGAVVVEGYFKPMYYTEFNNAYYTMDNTNSAIYTISTEVYQDAGNAIYYRARTPIVDHGTAKRKFYRSVDVIGDKTVATLYVKHTGNDYQTWSNVRGVDLSKTRPKIDQCGSDRRRAWEVYCTGNVPLRLRDLELDFDIGHMEGQGG